MKSSVAKRMCLSIIAVSLSYVSSTLAQPAAGPLDIQGLNQQVITGARSRAMGGTAVANATDASALFSNPAALSRLSSFEIRGGGLFGNTIEKQTQEWVPYMSNPGLSVLFESLTDPIPVPLDSLGNPLPPWKTLQRQYDNLKPNWNRSSSSVQPFSLVAASPLTIADVNITAGIGVSQAMNLDHFYQNNNALFPYLGQLRPDPKIITKPIDTVDAQWYQYIRERTGIVYGITPGIAVPLLPGLTLGGSATVLTGSSDDNEHRVERGHLYLATNNKATANDFMLDTVYYQQSKVGTSTYSGKTFTFGLLFQQDRYSIGVMIKPSYTLTRSWDRDVNSLDTTKKSFPVRIDSLTSRSYHESGKEDLKFPLAYSMGIVLTPTDNWTIAFDYEVRSLADMELISSASDSSSHPWINSSATLRFGAEYRPSTMFALRGGYREDIQAFSPDGSAIIGEPARGGTYSLGAGLTFGSILVDVTYEYSVLKYPDIYQSNVSYNTRERHQFMMEFAYRL
jgi:long-subunit fatty acid transport protein